MNDTKAPKNPSPAKREREGPIAKQWEGEGRETHRTKSRYVPVADPKLTPRARQLRRDQTPAERLLWSQLRGNRLGGHRFRRQDPIGPFIADFVCEAAKLVVELDGGQHADTIDYDRQRTRWFESKGYRVLRFWNGEVTESLEAVVRIILAELLPSPSHREDAAGPSLSRSAGEGFNGEG